jgi:hypothetical protein
MALELSKQNEIYKVSLFKFSNTLSTLLGQCIILAKDLSLWDDQDNFIDVVEMSDGSTERLKVRSLVGVIPMFAVEIMHQFIQNFNKFSNRNEERD